MNAKAKLQKALQEQIIASPCDRHTVLAALTEVLVRHITKAGPGHHVGGLERKHANKALSEWFALQHEQDVSDQWRQTAFKHLLRE